MRSVSPTLAAHLDAARASGTPVTPADLYTLTLSGGTIYRWTSADVDVIAGGYTFGRGGANGAPLISRGETSQSMDLEVDTLDVTLLCGDGAALLSSVPLVQVAANKGFDGATLQVDLAFLVGTTWETMPWFAGSVSKPSVSGTQVVLHLRGKLAELERQLPRHIIQAPCNHALFDAGCGLSRAAFAVSGTVGAGSTSSVVNATLAQATGYFDLGVLIINGIRASVKSWTAGGAFTLTTPLPFTPTPGTPLTAYPGCDKKLATCKTKFGTDNSQRHRGFPFVPSGPEPHVPGAGAQTGIKDWHWKVPGGAPDLVIPGDIEGTPVPIVIGTVRAPGILIWRRDPLLLASPSAGIWGAEGPVILALCEGPISGVLRAWRDQQKFASLADTGPNSPWGVLMDFSQELGARAQAPLAWVASAYPAEALGYGGTALVHNQRLVTDRNGNWGEWEWEIRGIAATESNGVSFDALPGAFLSTLLTSQDFGHAWPGANLVTNVGQDGLAASSFEAYCAAMGFTLSARISEREPTLDLLKRALEATNSAGIYSPTGVLRIFPLGDQAVGAYTPCTTIRAALDSSDFKPTTPDADPIDLDLKAREDVYNCIPVEFTDPAREYALRTIDNPEPADVDRFGLLKGESVSMPWITRPEHAMAMSRILAQQSAWVRGVYTWRLGWEHVRLEAGDLVTITDSRLGYTSKVVRIRRIRESGGYLQVTADDSPDGLSHAVGFTPAAPVGVITDQNVAPGNANAPVLAQAPAAYAGGKQRLFVLTSGGADWGGCDVWISWDNATWEFAGVIQGRNVHGTLTAILASGSDPDTTNTLAVDMGVSGGVLPNASVAERDALSTLCYVDGEWVSYATSSNPTGTTTNLTSLRRGVFGSTIGAHALGSVFARVKPDTFRLDIDTARVGQTLYLRLVSFNKWGRAQQDITALSSHSVVIAAQRAVPSAGNAVDFAQADPPTVRPDGSPLQVGDRWTETDDGNEPHRWNGSAWVSLRDGTIATAQGRADDAFTLASSKAKVTYAATPPASPATGDLWFSTDTTTNCPDDNCRGHTDGDGDGIPDVSVAAPHRALYWPHRWNGTAWVDGQGSQLVTASEIAAGAIVAAKIAAGAITAAKIQADALATTDYAEDGSGNPIAGAKMLANTTLTAWASNTAYSVGDKRSNGGKLYQCITAGTSAGAASAWASGTTYAVGNLVSYSGRTYYSLQSGNTNHQPNTSPTWWHDRGANTGPAGVGPSIWDGTVQWSTYAQLRVAPSGLQIGALPINRVIQTGTGQISGTGTSFSVFFPAAFADYSYRVVAVASDNVGTVPTGARVVAVVQKNLDGFTLSSAEAPGAGNYVNWDWIVVHDIP